jgi:hypothetical protein
VIWRAAPAGAARRHVPAGGWRVAAVFAVSAAFAIGAAAGVAGCGGTQRHGMQSHGMQSHGMQSHGQSHGMQGHTVTATGVLPKHAIAGLPEVTKALGPTDVQKDSSLHGLAGKLRQWGFQSGWQRTFQGESRRLTLVVSRSLSFRSRAGASAFVMYLGKHVDSFYPFAVSKPLELAGQSGWLIKPPLCACHMAQPLYVGVTTAGRQVRWLEINGPRASGALLTSLLAAV